MLSTIFFCNPMTFLPLPEAQSHENNTGSYHAEYRRNGLR